MKDINRENDPNLSEKAFCGYEDQLRQFFQERAACFHARALDEYDFDDPEEDELPDRARLASCAMYSMAQSSDKLAYAQRIASNPCWSPAKRTDLLNICLAQELTRLLERKKDAMTVENLAKFACLSPIIALKQRQKPESWLGTAAQEFYLGYKAETFAYQDIHLLLHSLATGKQEYFEKFMSRNFSAWVQVLATAPETDMVGGLCRHFEKKSWLLSWIGKAMDSCRLEETGRLSRKPKHKKLYTALDELCWVGCNESQEAWQVSRGYIEELQHMLDEAMPEDWEDPFFHLKEKDDLQWEYRDIP